MATTTRAQRIDAGKVTVTQRDRDVLTFITDHGGIRADTLAQVLGRYGDGDRLAPARSPRAVSLWVERMTRVGYVTRTGVLGQPWVLATAAGSRFAVGRERPGRITRHMADHHHVVATLRLWLEGRHPEATWVPEWRLRADWRGRVRRPDGLLAFTDGYRVGVEVELTPKRSDRYARIVAEQHPSLHACWWFAPGGQLPRLARLLGRPGAPARPVHKTFSIPEGWMP
jgi:hypothetical protein